MSLSNQQKQQQQTVDRYKAHEGFLGHPDEGAKMCENQGRATSGGEYNYVGTPTSTPCCEEDAAPTDSPMDVETRYYVDLLTSKQAQINEARSDCEALGRALQHRKMVRENLEDDRVGLFEKLRANIERRAQRMVNSQ